MEKVLNREEEIREIVRATGLTHIAIIMDGNRRWSEEKMLPTAMGHKEGVNALKKTMKACIDFGIKFLTVYAFSTENWNRSEKEVEFLLSLLGKTIRTQMYDMNKNGIRLRFLGDLSPLNMETQHILDYATVLTKENTSLNLQIAFNYGSRNEIANAVRGIIRDKIDESDVTEELISSYLYTKDIPDPELLIRTGGEKRLSNYLLWQNAYSEFLSMEKFWPDFEKNDLKKAILEFEGRHRRFGK